MRSNLSRRKLFRNTAGIATTFAVARTTAAATAQIASDWASLPDRVWIGPAYWANPLQDFYIEGGRLVCGNAAAERNVNLLTGQLAPRKGDFSMTVTMGTRGGGIKGAAGFRIGIKSELGDYRSSAIAGEGIDAGLADGKLFIASTKKAAPVTEGALRLPGDAIELRLSGTPTKDGYRLVLAAHDPTSGAPLGDIQKEVGPIDGNVALVANYQRAKIPHQIWFSNWRVSGTKLQIFPDRSFGPILFSQYTLSGGILKLTAQMAPVGPQEPQRVELQIKSGKMWKTIGEAVIHPQARTATFRIADWNAKVDVPYRVVYGKDQFAGTIRRDPADRPVLTVADISCNVHHAFPNESYVAKMGRINPDLLAFVGDQFYESTGGYGIVREPMASAILDYLRKWYMHGWTWRELLRDRPSVSLPDDHDVYHGNIWGEGGEANVGNQERGGYDMPPVWVNVVHRTQTSHHPDPFDPAPIKQDISTYYGELVYGRVSFAVIADRVFKSGPEGKVPKTGGRGDHVTDPQFDPKTADVAGAQLLGARQILFLSAWARDWKGADMKAVISQTIFAAMATTHGGKRERLRADYDANGWPQTPRNQALREIRRAFAVHIAGDQHLPAVIHYGIDEPRDAGVAFAGPAVNVGYPRWWEPTTKGEHREPGAHEHTGDYKDHFGNHMGVLAFANGAESPKGGILQKMRENASGLGIVRFDKGRRRVTMECWPFDADPARPGTQFPGWPRVVDMMQNYGRKATAFLPTLQIRGKKDPVVQVEDSKGEILYTLRVSGTRFQPHVFAPGRYVVRISDPEIGLSKVISDVEASAVNASTIVVVLAP